ncbi:MAG: hypothetical protein Q9216_004183 [Gyalolechia sp. 2 TL-2023]
MSDGEFIPLDVEIDWYTDCGRYVDPHLKEFSILYYWEPGRLPSQDMFTTIPQGHLIIAHDGYDEPFDSLNAPGASGNVVLNVGNVAGESTKFGSTFLYMLTDMFVQQRRFGNTGLDFEYGPQGQPPRKILEGSIMGLNSLLDRSRGDEVATA